MKSNKVRTIAAFFMLWSLVVSLGAQSGGSFTITKSVISGGGAQSSGGSFSLSGIIGQPFAGDDSSGGSFSVNSGFLTVPLSGVGLEGDVAPRPAGDGSVLSNDIVQVRRYLNGTAAPDTDLGEFQRADSAPRSTSGDGMISSNDVVQARRYQNNTDIQQQAAGPITENGGGGASAVFNKTFDNDSNSPQNAVAPRELRVESTTAAAGQSVTVNIRVDAMGDEAEYGFRLNYEASKLSNPTVGAGNAGASVRACNTAVAGVVNCSVGSFPTNNPNSTDPGIGEINAGNDQILITVTFNVAANAASGASPLTLTNVNASNDNADLLPISATNGAVTIIGPTAAAVSVSGRVVTPKKRGLVNALVLMTDQSGNTRVARTSISGYYRFEAVEVGQTYILTVASKHYQFAPQVLILIEEIENFNFIANGM